MSNVAGAAPAASGAPSPLLTSLFTRVPASGSTWRMRDRVHWFQALAAVIALDYPHETHTVQVSATSTDPTTATPAPASTDSSSTDASANTSDGSATDTSASAPAATGS